jgi:hypothetical protein
MLAIVHLVHGISDTCKELKKIFRYNKNKIKHTKLIKAMRKNEELVNIGKKSINLRKS